MDIQFLLEQMRKNGLDQKRFAQKLGVQETKITKIKQGKYLGSFSEIEKIIEVLHLNSHQAYRLLTGREEPKSPEESIMAKEVEEKDRMIRKLEDEIKFLREQVKFLNGQLAEKSKSQLEGSNSENSNNGNDTKRRQVKLPGRRYTPKKA